jgi:hypothetical protein
VNGDLFNSSHRAKAQRLVRQGKFDLSHIVKKSGAVEILAVLRQKSVGPFRPKQCLCPQTFESRAICVRAFRSRFCANIAMAALGR